MGDSTTHPILTMLLTYTSSGPPLLYIDIYFYLGWFWESNCNENCKKKFCSGRNIGSCVL